MAIARGKYAKAISDRSGMEFPYNEMVKEWNGSFVHRSEFERKHPQLELRTRGGDAEGLLNARPDRTENEVIAILGPNPFETITASSGIINVSEPAHGRSTGDTVRFRGALSTSASFNLATFIFFICFLLNNIEWYLIHFHYFYSKDFLYPNVDHDRFSNPLFH